MKNEQVWMVLGLALFAGAAAFSCTGEMNTFEARNQCFEDLLPYVPGYYFPPPGGAGASSSSSSNGNAVPSECEKAEDCPGAEEPRCAEAVCMSGKCGFLFKPVAKVESQIQGDCVSQYCDGQGKIIALPDVDPYNDGRQCTFDTCEGGVAKNIPMPEGGICPETGSGVCFEGECVECIGSLIGFGCSSGQTCDFTTCVPMHCSDLSFQPLLGETDLDCGGLCRPCLTPLNCKVSGDCVDKVCLNGSCKPALCTDGVKNGGETGIDCGGPLSCPRCGPNQTCELWSDCISGVCWAGLCQAPQCNDGIKNGDEQGVDCGGALCGACGG